MIRAIWQWHRGFSEINIDSAAMVIAGLPMMFIILGISIGITALSAPSNGGAPPMPHLPHVTVHVLVMAACFITAGALFHAYKKQGVWQSVKDSLNSQIKEGETTDG